MIFGRRTLCSLLLFTLWLVPQMSFGWGQDGHKIVAQVGTQLTLQGTQFWNSNIQNITNLAVIPDLKWKIGSLYEPETVTHFFQPDSYFKNSAQFGQIPHSFAAASSMVGAQNAVKWGSSPWRAQQFYSLALDALKRHDFQTAVVMAGVMAHYIGDMSQPLHVSENYDGQLTNDKGIHKFFETTNIQPNAAQLVAPVTKTAQALMKTANFQRQFDGNVVDETFNESFRAYAYKDQVINNDLKLGRTGDGAKQQLTLAAARMGDGAATLAALLSQMWGESGLKDAGATVAVQIPAWIQPNYYTAGISTEDLGMQIEMQTRRLLLEDDCGL